LRRHNPEIDWEQGEWRFTRCPESCAPRARKKGNVAEEEADELQLPREDPLITPLDDLGEECIENPHDNDTREWKTMVPEYLHEYGNVFSKKESERMPVRKPYDHGIDLEE
ncbi:hypothetical protein C8T65DRAFT_555510, partial [Cerioporus squamosus]